MAVIRCQACGKPNPDFLDVCQYCEARLKPMGSLAPLPGGADETLVSGPPASPSSAPANAEQTVPVGNMLDRLRSMGALSAEPETPAEPDETPAEADETSVGDWLSRLRGGQPTGTAGLPADRDAAAEPDWMWGGQAAATPPAQPETPPLAAAPPATPPSASSVPAEPDLPEWLQDSTTPPLPEAGATPAKPRRKMTDWLNALGGQGAAPPPEIDEVPDWLKGLASTTAASQAAAPASESAAPGPSEPVPPSEPATAAPASPATPADDAPDWLKTLRAGTTAEEPSGPGARRQQALPSWMRQDAAPPEAEPEPPTAETPAPPPVWGEAPRTPTPTQRMDAKPAWLRSPEPVEPHDQPAETPAPPPITPPVIPPLPAADATMPSLSAAPLPPADDMPAWLREIIAPAEEPPLAPATPAEPPKKKKMTDWLGAAPPPPGDAPAEAEELPEWLKNLSAAQATDAADAPPAEAAEGLPDWLQTVSGQAAAQPAEPPAPAQPEPVAAAPAAEPAVDLPDWLAAIRPTEAAPAAAPGLDEDTLSWLDRLSAAGEETPPTPAPAAADETLVAAPDETLVSAAPAAPPEQPDWMAEFAAASQVTTPAIETLLPGEAQPAAEAPAAAGDIQPTPENELPEWLRALRGLPTEDVPAEETPEWLRALRGLPETPAEPASAEPAMAGPPSAAPEAEPAATPASLPAWLAAMRPVDIEQTAAPEVDTYQESMGVLSGMRGVLRAEPVVAHVHQAAAAVPQLHLTDAQSASVRLLAELAPVEAAVTVRRKGGVNLGARVERWVIFGILALAIGLAQFQFGGLFGPPARIAAETHDAYRAVADLAAQSGAPGTPPDPVLIALDYEAGQQGELNPAVQAILNQALAQGNPVVMVSTKPEGAAVAQAVLSGTTAIYGQQVVNLGYLPGGPVGLLQFASAPRSSFIADFTGALPDVWAAPAAAGVERLEDFGVVVVAASSAQALRGWIEQVQFVAPGAPLVAVVSAGAEPMTRPYLQGADPQLAGMVAGVAGAAQYERQAGQSGAATALWPALGGGLWTAAVLIAGGNLVFGLLALIRRRRK